MGLRSHGVEQRSKTLSSSSSRTASARFHKRPRDQSGRDERDDRLGPSARQGHDRPRQKERGERRERENFSSSFSRSNDSFFPKECFFSFFRFFSRSTTKKKNEVRGSQAAKGALRPLRAVAAVSSLSFPAFAMRHLETSTSSPSGKSRSCCCRCLCRRRRSCSSSPSASPLDRRRSGRARADLRGLGARRPCLEIFNASEPRWGRRRRRR